MKRGAMQNSTVQSMNARPRRRSHSPSCDAVVYPVPLFDVQTGCEGAAPGDRERFPAAALAGEMKRVGIQKALVRILPDELDVDFEASNERLYAICRRRTRLVPCPVVIPASAGDVPVESAQTDRHARAGAGAVWIRPSRDAWIIAEWCSGNLFAALERRRLPVFCSERYVSLEQAGQIASAYPRLPLIVAEVGYAELRPIISLLRNFPAVHLSTGSVFTGHMAIERLVELAGPEKLLFGTGFPPAEPMAAISQLMYAAIPRREREMIAHGNMERLIGNIVR